VQEQQRAAGTVDFGVHPQTVDFEVVGLSGGGHGEGGFYQE
jgi:hypothetical protein